MKAAVINQYGKAETFQIADVDTPTVDEHAVLIKMAASSINPIDWKIRQGKLRGIVRLKFPAILGYDFAGTIEQVGSKVQDLQVGDEVFGVSDRRGGEAYAEYLALNANIVAKKPKAISMSESAAIPLAALTALQALRDLANLQPNQSVLVIGGSGGVGIFAIQIAKILGAQVTAVCSGKNIEFVRLLGADESIDYQRQPSLTKGKTYDVIFDTVAKHNFLKVRPYLKKQGVYITTLPDITILISHLMRIISRKKAKFILMKANRQDLQWLAQQVDQSKLKPVIDSFFSLSNIAKAHTLSETERARGKIVLTIGGLR